MVDVPWYRSVGPFLRAAGNWWWIVIGVVLSALGTAQPLLKETTIGGVIDDLPRWVYWTIGLACIYIGAFIAYHKERKRRLELQDIDKVESLCEQLCRVDTECAGYHFRDVATIAGGIVRDIRTAGGFRFNPLLERAIDTALAKKSVVQAITENPTHPTPNLVRSEPEYVALTAAIMHAEKETGLSARFDTLVPPGVPAAPADFHHYIINGSRIVAAYARWQLGIVPLVKVIPAQEPGASVSPSAAGGGWHGRCF